MTRAGDLRHDMAGRRGPFVLRARLARPPPRELFMPSRIPLLLLSLTLLSAGPAAAAESEAPARLGHDVAPTAQAIRLRLDPERAVYSGSVRVELAVRKPAASFRF